MPSLVVYSAPATEPITVSEVMDHCRIDADNQEPAPGALTCALAGAGAGNVENGAHRYIVTFVTSTGETQAGDISAAVTVTDKTINGKIALSAIPLGGSLVTSRKIYRTVAAGTAYLLLTTIADNTTTTYTDNIADASLGAEVPATNTTGDALLNVLIATVRQAAETILKRYLITQTVDLYLDEFPCWEISLPPLQSVTAITYFDTDGVEQTLASNRYLVDNSGKPARITPVYGNVWPSARYQNNAVKIRFLAGYGAAADVPQCIKTWMMMRIKTIYEVRDSVTTSNGSIVLQPEYIDRILDPEKVYY